MFVPNQATAAFVGTNLLLCVNVLKGYDVFFVAMPERLQCLCVKVLRGRCRSLSSPALKRRIDWWKEAMRQLNYTSKVYPENIVLSLVTFFIKIG